MQLIKFECESITPMFMYGADGSTPELRPASIKGVLRFWWRAIHGNLGLEELHGLHGREGEIFGSTKRRSNASLRITTNEKSIKSFQALIKEVEDFNGIKYNFYPIFMKKDEDYFASFTFELIVSSYNHKALEEAIDALIYLNFFGAIGSRGRRGAGSIKVTVKENTNKLFQEKLNLLNTNEIRTTQEFKNTLEQLMQNIKPHSSPTYTTFCKQLYIFNPQKDWKSALEKIAANFKDFRNSHKSRVMETPNFGFPIRHKDGSVFIGGQIQWNKKDEAKAVNIAERRASPLLFKVFKTSDDCYFPLIIWMNGNLLPDDKQVIFKKPINKNNIQQKKPSEDIINEFIGQFDKEDYLKVVNNG